MFLLVDTCWLLNYIQSNLVCFHWDVSVVEFGHITPEKSRIFNWEVNWEVKYLTGCGCWVFWKYGEVGGGRPARLWEGLEFSATKVQVPRVFSRLGSLCLSEAVEARWLLWGVEEATRASFGWELACPTLRLLQRSGLCLTSWQLL